MAKNTEVFNIGDEFKVTDEMEDGAKIKLSKDAYFVVRYSKSDTFYKGIRKTKEDNPDIDTLDMMNLSIAEFGLIDIKNVCLPDGTEIKNTKSDKLKLLTWKGKGNSEPPFRKMVFDAMGKLGNFPGAGPSLSKI